MKKSKKTIIYMLIALVVAVAAVFVDFGSCYASSGEGFASSAWRWYKYDASEKKCNSISCPDVVVDYDSYVGLDYEDVSVLSGSDSLTHKCTVYDIYSEYGQSRSSVYSFGSSGEIIALLTTDSDYSKNFNGGTGNDGLFLYIISKSNMKYVCNHSIYLSGNWKINTSLSTNGWFWNDVNLPSSPDSNSNYYTTYIINLNNEIYSGVSLSDDVKFFDDASSAYAYIDSGDTSGVKNWNPDNAKETITYDKNVHFDSFNMDVHASNSLDNYYVDFRYKLPNSLLGKGYCLRIDSTYRREVTNTITGESMSSKDYTDYQYVTLFDNPFSCRIYLKDFNSIKASFKDKYNDPFSKYIDITSDNYDAVFLGVTTYSASQLVYKVSLSSLSLSCKLEKSDSRGFTYDGSLDLLSGENDICSYTPNASGNYKPNNDYRQNGYYYTNVSTDSAENTTYNYYYISNDNSRTEITKDEADNNSKSGEGLGNNSSSSASTSGNITNNNSPTFNTNITIEGDSINNEANNIVDSSTSAEDNKNFIEKFLGFFYLLENNSFLGVWGKVFGWLPPGVSTLISSALGISVGISIFRFFRR